MHKIAAKYRLVFTTLFVACFAWASISLAVHGFSHKISFLQKVDNSSYSIADSISALDLAKKHKSSSHDLSHCSLCFLSGLQNNIIFSATIAFAAAAFYLFLTWREFDRTKLAYLSSSFLSRAPPFVS